MAAAAAAAAPAAAAAAADTTAAVDAGRKVRWGIMSTAGIATKNHLAATAARNATVVAVASRDAGRAAAWAAERGIPTSYGSYEELLADASVEAVYVPLPTALHVEWVVKAAAAGKAVLCEKPVACNAGELRRMLAACDAAGVQWMDGVMFMHHTRLRAMASHFPSLGDRRRVTVGFTFPADGDFLASNIRVKKELEPLGAVGDLAWYAVRFALWAFDYATPEWVTATAHESTPDGVPLTVTGTVGFPGGRLLTFDVGFSIGFRQWAEVAGTAGNLCLDDFCIARSHESASFTVTTGAGLADAGARIADKRAVVEVRDCNQEAAMFETFSALVAAGKVDATWPRVSLQTQLVMDALMASIAADGARTPVAPL
mgnify:CR=1 FL=1